MKMSLEEVKKRELVRLVEVQKQEQKALAEPKTLVGAVRALNELNDGRTSQGAQQRLRSKAAPVRDRSTSSVRIVGEKKADPERERGETSRQDDSSRGGCQAGRCRHTSRRRA